MKKILSLIVLLLVVGVLAAPKIIDNQYKQQLAEMVKIINDQPSASANLKLVNSSWFGSKHELDLSIDTGIIDPNTNQTEKVDTKLLIDSRYGPLLFSDQGLFGLVAGHVTVKGDKLRDVYNWDQKEPFYKASFLTGFTQRTVIDDKIPAYTYMQGRMHVDEYLGHGEVNPTHAIYDSGIKAITMLGASPIQVKNIGLHLDFNPQDMMSGGFHDYNARFKVDQLQFEDSVNLDGLVFDISSVLDKEKQLASVQQHSFVKHFSGDGFEFNNLNLVMELKNLNNQVLLDFKKQYPNLNATDPQDVLAFYQQKMPDFLASKPEFNVLDMSGDMPDGHFQATATSKLADIDPADFDKINNPRFWVYYAIAHGDAKADATLVNALLGKYVSSKMGMPENAPQVQQQSQIILDSVLQKDLIQKKGNEYLAEFHIQDGEVKVNNTSFPL